MFMKSLIEIGLVALVVGGASATASFYLKTPSRNQASVETVATAQADDKSSEQTKLSESSEADPDAADDEAVKPADEVKTAQTVERSTFGPPVAVRPPFDPNADEAGNLINRLRVRATSASRQERRLAEREDLMKLIVDDLHVEQKNSARLRQRISEEADQSLRAVDEALRETESERAAIQYEQAETRRSADEEIQELRREKDEAVSSSETLLKSIRDEQEEMKKQLEELRKSSQGRGKNGAEDNANLKKMVGVVDSMPPEDTAKILQELIEKDQTESAVAILNAMKARQSAKVLSAITESDPILAADLIDRLKRLKRDREPPPDPPK
jgi:flagellar motility protein MotE (MotC chaperone)